MLIQRVWAMPNKNTFEVNVIRCFVKKYLAMSSLSVDPFARNCDWCNYTNDLNRDTKAQYHLDSADFLGMLHRDEVEPDLVLLDPPYSPTQMKRSYDSIGLKMDGRDALRTAGWKVEKDLIAKMLTIDGVVLSFGWNSNGMGKGRGFEIVEILLVCHGAGHNDTICMAERRSLYQYTFCDHACTEA